MSKIVIDDLEFSLFDISGGKVSTTHAMAGEALSANAVRFTVYDTINMFVPADQDYPLITEDDRVYYAAKYDSLASKLVFGTPVYYHADDTVHLYYLKQFEQIATNKFVIDCTSAVGMLIDTKHYGGIYLQAKASDVLAEILDGVTYTIDDDLASATITGYLPIASHRDNLQQVLLAIGGGITVETDGTMRIAPMSPVATGEFDATRCFAGGRVKETTKYVGLCLTEHNYIENGDEATLYDDGLDGEETIEFSEPHHDLTITGGTIVESGANYAKISGSGSVVLTGQKYTHITRVIRVGDVSNASTTKTVSQAYLANPQVAQTIAERLLTVAQCNKTITREVVVGTERAGDVVSILNPYTRQMETGIIRSMDVSVSAVDRAQIECVVGFAPQGVLSGFTSYELLTGEGTFVVPDDVTKIRIIVVGAGSGGDGGTNGGAGSSGEWDQSSIYEAPSSSGGVGGAGGAGGANGVGGSIYEISLDVTPGQAFGYVCGTAGTRGAANGGAGLRGGATYFGDYASDSGRQYPYGYYEAMTGMTFGAFGVAGVAGGAGGNGADDDSSDGTDGTGVTGYSGGKGTEALSGVVYSGTDGGTSVLGTRFWAGGGGGGGAANGSRGGDAVLALPAEYYEALAARGGNGGDGADGADASNYGQGGGGGNGGGGAGGGGVYTKSSVSSIASYDRRTYDAGTPGTGGKGGKGGAGCVIVYY